MFSPFVNLFSQAGIAAAAIIMNLVVLSSVMSSMNSGVFSTSRMLFGLSREEQGTKILWSFELNRAVPANALYFSCMCVYCCGACIYKYFVTKIRDSVYSSNHTFNHPVYLCLDHDYLELYRVLQNTSRATCKINL